MPRNTKKSNVTQEIADAINTPIDFEWDETAQKLGVPIPDLQERMASKLNATVFSWELIPHEHQPVIDQIARDLDAERSTRKLEPEAEIPQLAETTELPLVEEPGLEAKPPKSESNKKPKGGQLTKGKEAAIDKGREASNDIQDGVTELLIETEVELGIQDGADAGTAYLHSFQATRNQVKGTGLEIIAAENLQKISKRSGLSLDEILKRKGISTSPETRERLAKMADGVLGKMRTSTEAVVSTAWGNGVHLGEELTHLDTLMNSEE